MSRFNALIYQWAIRLTTILFAGLGIAILPILAEGYGTIKIAFAISEIAILHPSLLVIFYCARYFNVVSMIDLGRVSPNS